MKFLKILFSDASNKDVDFSKVMGALALVGYLGLSTYSYISKDAVFDPLAWSTGISVIVASAAGVSKFKDSSGTKTD